MTYDVFYIDNGKKLLYDLNVSLVDLEDVIRLANINGHVGIVIYPNL